MKTALVLALALTGCGFSTKTPPPKGETTVSSVITLTSASFQALKAQSKPVLMDFWAPWCGPCRQQGPIVDQVATELGDKAMVAKVNVDEEKDLARDFGIQAIPTEYFEAAAIDGASGWAIFRYITLPMLRPVLAVTTVLNLLYGLKVFDIVFVLTNGGPGRATDTVYTIIFDEFSKGRWGVATALSSLLFIVMVGLGYFVIRLMTREEGA